MPKYTITINNQSHAVEADADTPLLWVLRDELDLKGTKFGCGKALCGACTVHVNGIASRACSLPIGAVKGKVTTIEGLATDTLSAVQQAWVDLDVAQCGYCQAGQVMSATALLMKKPNPTDADIDSAMSGNICRCGTYTRIRQAIKVAAQNQGSKR